MNYLRTNHSVRGIRRSVIGCGIMWLSAGLLLVLLVDPGDAARPKPRPGNREADQAGKEVTQMAQEILRDYFAVDMPLIPEDIDAINSALNDKARYQKSFTADQKGSVMLIRALVAHSSQKRDEALAAISQAQRLAPFNGDVSDAAIALGLYWEDYELARAALKARNAGTAVQRQGADATAGPGVIGGLADPNATATRVRSVGRSAADPNTAGPGQKKPAVPAKPASRFGKYATAPSKPTGPGATRPGKQKPYGGGVGIGPMGDQFGAIGPADPTLIQGGMKSRTPRPPRHGKKTVKKEPEFTPSTLGLPVESMLYEQLGQPMSKLQLRTINGSYFHYEPGNGQLLFMLLWMLPEDGRDIVAGKSSPRRKKPARAPMAGPGGYMPGMPGAPGGMPVQRPRKPSKSAKGRPASVFEITTDLGAMFEQLRGVFETGLIFGGGNVVAVNLDPPSRKAMLTDQLMKNSWPWATCMAHEGFNESNWPLDETVSPVLVVVGTQDKIRYMGPIGGFLPEMLIKMELPKVAVRQLGMPALPEMNATMEATVAEMAGQLLQGLQQMQNVAPGSQQVPVASQPQPQAQQSQQRAAGATPVVTQKKSVRQAADMLRAARVKRRLTPKSACDTCDDVINRWPDSLEAEEAKLMIESIIRRDKRLTEQRESQGKYTGR